MSQKGEKERPQQDENMHEAVTRFEAFVQRVSNASSVAL